MIDSCVWLDHKVLLITFDGHFQDIAKICGLRVRVLVRPD
jgi:hypothetical protein